ncbi:MAG: DegV family protein [Dehalococcoidales bacterium]|nr:DegV family protein [Dehalococcoidales bacterium]
MKKIAVVTDSIACIPPEIQEKYEILIAPCYVIWDKVQYRDGIDMTSREAYARLRTSESVPTTTSAIQGEYIKIFESLQGKVDGIVTVTVTGGMGASYTSALAAKEIVPETPIQVIDSRNSYLAQGFMAIAGAKVAQAGGSLEEVSQAVEEVVSKARTFWYVDTLEYLKKSGRVNLPQAVLDNWVKRNVMMVVKDGVLAPQPLEGNPQDQLIELLGQMAGDGNRLHIGIVHGDLDPEDLKNRIASKFDPVEILVSWLSPVAGVHVGPGMMGVSFYNE